MEAEIVQSRLCTYKPGWRAHDHFAVHRNADLHSTRHRFESGLSADERSVVAFGEKRLGVIHYLCTTSEAQVLSYINA